MKKDGDNTIISILAFTCSRQVSICKKKAEAMR